MMVLPLCFLKGHSLYLLWSKQEVVGDTYRTKGLAGAPNSFRSFPLWQCQWIIHYVTSVKPARYIRSDQISRSVMFNFLWPHESQHARPPCPSPTPGVHSDSRPSSQWCHPAISSSVLPFSSCSQSLPESESFPMSQLFAWGGQSTGVSASDSFLPKKSQGWSPSEWTGWISLQSKGLSRVFSNTTVQKHQHIVKYKQNPVELQRREAAYLF